MATTSETTASKRTVAAGTSGIVASVGCGGRIASPLGCGVVGAPTTAVSCVGALVAHAGVGVVCASTYCTGASVAVSTGADGIAGTVVAAIHVLHTVGIVAATIVSTSVVATDAPLGTGGSIVARTHGRSAAIVMSTAGPAYTRTHRTIATGTPSAVGSAPTGIISGTAPAP